MSYILDALKRAEAERGERRPQALSEAVGAASQPAGAGPKAAPNKRWIWGLLAAVVLLAGASILGWQRLGKTTVAVQPADPVASPKAPTVALAAPAAPAATAPPDPEPEPATAPVPAPAPVLPILAKAPPAPPPPPPPPKGSARPNAGEASATQASPPLNAAEAPPAPADPPTPGALPALSAAARAALPPIQVSGSSYSTNREHRMLIANGQVVKEGHELSPGLTLEVIGPRSVVFNHRGTRFNINY